MTDHQHVTLVNSKLRRPRREEFTLRVTGDNPSDSAGAIHDPFRPSWLRHSGPGGCRRRSGIFNAVTPSDRFCDYLTPEYSQKSHSYLIMTISRLFGNQELYKIVILHLMAGETLQALLWTCWMKPPNIFFDR